MYSLSDPFYFTPTSTPTSVNTTITPSSEPAASSSSSVVPIWGFAIIGGGLAIIVGVLIVFVILYFFQIIAFIVGLFNRRKRAQAQAVGTNADWAPSDVALANAPPSADAVPEMTEAALATAGIAKATEAVEGAEGVKEAGAAKEAKAAEDVAIPWIDDDPDSELAEINKIAEGPPVIASSASSLNEYLVPPPRPFDETSSVSPTSSQVELLQPRGTEDGRVESSK